MDQTAKPSLDQILLDLTTKKQGILRQPVPGSDRVIDDPVAHANACYGGGYRVTEYVDRWRKESEYHTTGEFAEVRAKSVLHCGPTAITNLLRCFYRRTGNRWMARHSAADLFEVVASEGSRILAYHNGSWHSLFGGTSDLMAGHFINKAADAVGMPSLAQSPPVMIVNRQLYTWMKEGNLAFLMLHRHECYRNHHVLCNGVITVTNHKGENHRYYQIMDGWAHRPRYVDERSVKGDLFWKIPQP